ncbi:hypothetical protein [Rubritalea sp.]|uniref:hypothetical protein n=1 Tax=Rubritalea sp. TaxID=2109375 RepID=UPI003EF45FFF
MKPTSYEIEYSDSPKTLYRQNRPFKIKKTVENIKFVHVGKCSGTSVLYHLNANGIDIEEYHRKQPPNLAPFLYFIWIRNPIKRFTSAFNHSKAIIDFEIQSLQENEILTLDNCPAPSKIQRKIDTGYAFNPAYDKLVSEFHSANTLAESLSSKNHSLKSRAIELMQRPEEHLYKGIGWHLDDGKFLKYNKEKIIQVGTTENFNDDLKSLCEKLSIEFKPDSITWTRKAPQKYTTDLSELAVKNLRNFYKCDFKCINKMKSLKLIGQESYHKLLG